MAMKDWLRRINFFKGFFTQASDWQAAQDYHLTTQRLHRAHLHTPGVVEGVPDNLRVSVAQGGTSVFVATGYAIDGEGRDLYVPEPQQLTIRPRDYSPPVMLYVVIRYHEEMIDERPNPTNPEFSGHAFVQERPVVEATTDVPDNHSAIELARINLSADANRIRDPQNPDAPGANEIDIRHVLRAGAVRAQVRLSDLGRMVRDARPRVSGEREVKVVIETAPGGDAHRYYVASVYPEGEGSISWRIEANRVGDGVEYSLFLRNLKQNPVNVNCRVYSLI
jgi:hypothetical protein